MLSIAALLGAPAWALLILGLGWVGCVAWFAFLPVVYIPRLFKMYGNPWSASAALLANLHLICECCFSSFDTRTLDILSGDVSMCCKPFWPVG